jgi:amino acid transporter
MSWVVTPLGRSMRRFGALMLTLSGITPAASVFIIGQTVVQQAGTGAVLAFAGVALLGLATAYVYAEVSSAFPLTGGEYSVLGRTLGPTWGMMALGINLFGGPLGQAAFALGLADYLGDVIPGLPALPAALAVTAGTTIVTLLNIRLNAIVTGAFLAVELAALSAMTALGLFHGRQPLTDIVLHPVMTTAGGALVPTPWPAIGLAAAGAVYAVNGYGGAMFFGEEMYEARAKVAWVVFASLAVAVVAELVPVAAALAGAPDLAAVLAAPEPFKAFLTLAGGPFMEKAVSLGVAISIVNAMIAVGLINARQLYCSGRDGVWPAPISRAMAAVHPRFHSPWIATLVMGAATAACCFVKLELLVMLTGYGLVLVYAGVAMAALAGRSNGTTAAGDYRMPAFPVWPVLTLVGAGAVAWAAVLDPVNGQPSLLANLAVSALFAAYWAFYLRRRKGWVLRGADGLPLDEGGAASLAE